MSLLIALTISLSGVAVLSALYVVVASQIGVVIDAESGPVATGDAASPPVASAATERAGASAADSSPSTPVKPGPMTHGGSVGFEASATTEILRRTLVWFAGIVLALTLVSAALGWWISGRLLRRVTQITETARTVANGDLSARLALPGPKDEIAELGDTFDLMLDRLDGAMTAQRRFVANASHELRTPLATGRLALEAPLEQGLLEGEGAVAAERALGSFKRASTTLSALLSLATTAASTGELEEAVDLALLAEESIRAHADLASSRDLRIDATLGPALTTGEPPLLGRALDNLVRNALVHSTEGSTVTFTTRTTLGEVTFETSNTGHRFDSVGVRDLVEPFHRGPESRLTAVEGSGLGLSIVAAVVDRHSGHLDIAARDDGGLRVVMAIPAEGARPSAASPRPAPPGIAQKQEIT